MKTFKKGVLVLVFSTGIIYLAPSYAQQTQTEQKKVTGVADSSSLTVMTSSKKPLAP